MTTDNHSYNEPSPDATDWYEQLNANTRNLEVDVTVADTHVTIDPSIASDASEVQYTPHDGAVFLAVDSGAVFRGDGSTWTHLGSIPVQQRVVVSGDGSQQTFTVGHSLPTAPSAVQLSPTSEAAAAAHWVSDKRDTEFDITFATPPETGTDNVTFDASVEV